MWEFIELYTQRAEAAHQSDDSGQSQQVFPSSSGARKRADVLSRPLTYPQVFRDVSRASRCSLVSEALGAGVGIGVPVAGRPSDGMKPSVSWAGCHLGPSSLHLTTLDSAKLRAQLKAAQPRALFMAAEAKAAVNECNDGMEGSTRQSKEC